MRTCRHSNILTRCVRGCVKCEIHCGHHHNAPSQDNLSPYHTSSSHHHNTQDGSGSITVDEIVEGLKGFGGMTDKEIKELIKEADKNNDGTIDYGEFLTMMRRNNKELAQATSIFRTAFNLTF